MVDLKVGLVVSIEPNMEYQVLGDNGIIQKSKSDPQVPINYMVVATNIGNPEVNGDDSIDTVLKNLKCGTIVYADSGDLINFRGFCPKCGKIAPYCSSCDALHCSCQKA